MIIQTARFGQLEFHDDEVVDFPQGVFGFPDLRKFALVDSADDTLILWMQSLEQPSIALPLLEPKIFKPEYTARLSATEMRELKLENINSSAVFSILTIPDDITLMSANLKAPIVLNLKLRIGRQVVLQENEYGIKHLMFQELKKHIVTMQSLAMARSQSSSKDAGLTTAHSAGAIRIQDIPPSLTVKSLQTG